MTKYKRIREMTIDERADFENTTLSFQTITQTLSNNEKCNLFNRLQNGEKTDAITKFKNLNHPITNFFREKNIINSDLLCDWKKILLIDKGVKSTKRTKGTIIRRIVIIIIRLLLICDRENINMSYLDLNILKYIEHGTESVKINGNINNLYNKVLKIKEKITHMMKGVNVIEEFYYLLHLLIIKDETLFDNIQYLNKKDFDKFNSPLLYKEDINKILTKESLKKKYDDLVKILSDINKGI